MSQDRIDKLEWWIANAPDEGNEKKKAKAQEEISRLRAELATATTAPPRGPEPGDINQSDPADETYWDQWKDFVGNALGVNDEDPSAATQFMVGAGRTVDSMLTGMQQLYYGATGNKEKVEELEGYMAGANSVYEVFDEKGIWDDIGEAIPELVAFGIAPVGAGLKGGALAGAIAAGLRGTTGDQSRGEEMAWGALGGGAGNMIFNRAGGNWVKDKISGAVKDPLEAYKKDLLLSAEGIRDLFVSFGGGIAGRLGKSDAGRIGAQGLRKLGKRKSQSDELLKILRQDKMLGHEKSLELAKNELKVLQQQRIQAAEQIGNEAYDLLAKGMSRLSQYGQRGVGGRILLDRLEEIANKGTTFNKDGLPMLDTSTFLKEWGMFNPTKARKQFGPVWTKELEKIHEFMREAPKRLMPVDEVISAYSRFLQHGANPKFDDIPMSGVRALAARSWGALGVTTGVQFGTEREDADAAAFAAANAIAGGDL